MNAVTPYSYPLIGNPVVGSTASTVLTVDASGKLTNSVNLAYDGTTLGVVGNVKLNSGSTAAEQFLLAGRVGVGVPVPYLTPTTATKVIALDVFPNGAPSDFSSTTGVAWVDVCSSDIAADGTNYECLRMGKLTAGVSHVGSAKGGTGTVRDIVLQLNGGNVCINNTDTTLSRTGTAALATNGTFTATSLVASSTAPSVILTDTTASAKSLTIAVDANLADLRESAGASGSLMTLDLANNRIGFGTAAPSFPLHQAVTSTNLSGSALNFFTVLTPSPASDTTSSFTAFVASVETAATAVNYSTGAMVAITPRIFHFGSGTIADVRGCNLAVRNRSTGTMTQASGGIFGIQNESSGTITTAYCGYFQVPVQTGTVGTMYGCFVALLNDGTCTNAIGVSVATVGGGSAITTVVGVDVAAQTRGATNIGVRIALPSGGATANYALQLSDATGVAAGGITFGADATPTTLYRSAANTVKTDGSFVVGAKVTSYNGIATVSGGVPSELATIDTTGLTANVAAATLYVVPSSGAGMYRVSAYVVITTAGSISSTLPNVQVVYTDKDSNTSVTVDATPVLAAAGLGQTGALTANTVGSLSSGELAIYVKASTTIQYQTVNYASNIAGMTYALHVKLEAMG